jgi:hypothetical protein
MRRRVIAKRDVAAVLGLNDEITAAGMLHCFWTEEQHRSRSWWAGVKHVHGNRIAGKVRESMPGCRPGYCYALGEFPPLPLVQPIPAQHLASREQLTVEGVQHWYCGGPWQRCQAGRAAGHAAAGCPHDADGAVVYRTEIQPPAACAVSRYDGLGRSC